MAEDAELKRLAWHDVTCAEADECRDRDIHAMSLAIPQTVLDRYHDRLTELRQLVLVSSDRPFIQLA